MYYESVKLSEMPEHGSISVCVYNVNDGIFQLGERINERFDEAYMNGYNWDALIRFYVGKVDPDLMEEEDWHRVYSTDQLHKAEIVKAVLADHHMNPVLINKRDSSYHNFGEIEVHVTTEFTLKARQIIENDINLE